jgi:hypothetical protein
MQKPYTVTLAFSPDNPSFLEYHLECRGETVEVFPYREWAYNKAMQKAEQYNAAAVDRRIDGYNPEFLGAKPARAGEDY